jgi:general secretion pathway protein D
MAYKLKKTMMLAAFFWAVQFVCPSLLPAARVAGEDVPVPAMTAPTVATPRPGQTPPVVKRQEKKDVPVVVPQSLDKKESSRQALDKKEPSGQALEKKAASGQAQMESVVIQTQPAPTVPTPGTFPAKLEQTSAVKAAGNAALPPPAATAAAAATETKKPAAKSTQYVTIDFDNVDIQVFVKFVSELTGKNFVIDEKVKGKVTIISPRKISIDEVYKVFESVLEVYGFATVTAADVIKIVPALQAREKQLETRVGKQDGNQEDKIVTQIISLENANPDEVKKVLDPLISRTSIIMSYPPTGMLVITDYLSNIQKIMEIVAALDVEGMAGQISYVTLKKAVATEVVKSLTLLFQPQAGRIPVAPIRMVADERANAIILAASSMDSDRIKKLIEFMDKDIPKGAATLKVYRLQNAVAEDLAKVLMNIPKGTTGASGAAGQAGGGKSPLLSKDVQIVADKATNTLIITATIDDYKVLEDVIQSLDVSRPMVYIEALIMEVKVTKNFQVGVEWRAVKDTTSTTAMGGLGSAAFIGSGGMGAAGAYNAIPNVSIGTTGSSLSFPQGFSLGMLGAGISIGGVMFPSIGAVLQAYQNDSDISILSTPQIMTLDNEEAEINVGENVPYLSRQDTTSGISTVAGGINYSSYEYKDVGVTLKITPHINAEDFVRLKFDQKVSKVSSGGDIARPTTLTRQAKSTVVVKDKETIVIGGLVGDETTDSTYQLPCLGSIPVLGWLFKSASQSRAKTNLYVFITPHIIRTQKEAAEFYKVKRNEMGEVKDGVIKLNEKAMPKSPDAESKK